jgi:hypothetical protein
MHKFERNTITGVCKHCGKPKDNFNVHQRSRRKAAKPKAPAKRRKK